MSVPSFDEVLAEMKALHDKKGHDYGSNKDEYANIRAAEEFGIRPWVGAAIRLNDKVTRIKSFIEKGVLMNESILDAFDDIAAYAIIAKIMYLEDQEPK